MGNNFPKLVAGRVIFQQKKKKKGKQKKIAGCVPAATKQASSKRKNHIYELGATCSAYEVIKMKGYTSWAIGTSCAVLTRAILSNQRTVYAISTSVQVPDDSWRSCSVLLCIFFCFFSPSFFISAFSFPLVHFEPVFIFLL